MLTIYVECLPRYILYDFILVCLFNKLFFNSLPLDQFDDNEKYQCAHIDENKCIFHKKCKPIENANGDESWTNRTYSQKKILKNAENFPEKSLYNCSKRCKNERCTFFSWDSTTGTCLISKKDTEICVTSKEKVRQPKVTVIQAKYCCKEKTFLGYECKNEDMIIPLIDKDPNKACVKDENNMITIYRYKLMPEYNRWNAIKSSYWLWTCVLLCAINIFIGGPMLFHLYQNDDLVEDDGKLEIHRDKFVALAKLDTIPRVNEWSDLIDDDLDLHVMKFSTGYASNFPSLNRWVCTNTFTCTMYMCI